MTEGDFRETLDNLDPIPPEFLEQISRSIYCHRCERMRDDARILGRPPGRYGYVVECQGCVGPIYIRGTW